MIKIERNLETCFSHSPLGKLPYTFKKTVMIMLDYDQDILKSLLFSQSIINRLPDYDQDISVFDYYLDESGEWELWRSRYHMR
jgi:hypothetical protein